MIEVKNLSSSYGKKEVLKGIFASFEKGKITSVAGPNGCGKTTLLNSIMGIIPLKRNTVYVDGEDAFNLKGKPLARKISYLSQGKTVPDMTVEALVLHGRFPLTGFSGLYTNEDKNAAFSAMEKLDISHLAEKRISTLSGGMRQIVYLAMALCRDSDYIIMDEPTTYLDISNQAKLFSILKKLAESNKGIITVLHDLPFALNFSDSIVLMQEGKVSIQDTPENVYKSGIINDISGVEIKKSEDGYYYKF